MVNLGYTILYLNGTIFCSYFIRGISMLYTMRLYKKCDKISACQCYDTCQCYETINIVIDLSEVNISMHTYWGAKMYVVQNVCSTEETSLQCFLEILKRMLENF